MEQIVGRLLPLVRLQRGLVLHHGLVSRDRRNQHRVRSIMSKSRVLKLQVIAALAAGSFIMWVVPPAWKHFLRGEWGNPQDYVDVDLKYDVTCAPNRPLKVTVHNG